MLSWTVEIEILGRLHKYTATLPTILQSWITGYTVCDCANHDMWKPFNQISLVLSIGSCQSSDSVVFSIGYCQSSDTVVFSIGYCPPTVWYFGFLISLIIHNNIENIKLDGKIYSFYSVHAVMGFVISHLAGPTMPVQLPFSRNNYVCLC